MSTKRKKQERANTKRQQKRGLKAAQRAKLNKHKSRPNKMKGAATLAPQRPYQVPLDMFPDSEYKFWLAHGANYLASDYDSGQWTPIFPEVYEGKLLEHKALIERAMEAGNNYALAWLLNPREALWVYYMECLKAKTAAGSTEPAIDVKKPHDPTIWDVFVEMKARWDARRQAEAPKSPASAPESPDLPAPA